jgi:hypothetical protein
MIGDQRGDPLGDVLDDVAVDLGPTVRRGPPRSRARRPPREAAPGEVVLHEAGRTPAAAATSRIDVALTPLWAKPSGAAARMRCGRLLDSIGPACGSSTMRRRAGGVEAYRGLDNTVVWDFDTSVLDATTATTPSARGLHHGNPRWAKVDMPFRLNAIWKRGSLHPGAGPVHQHERLSDHRFRDIPRVAREGPTSAGNGPRPKAPSTCGWPPSGRTSPGLDLGMAGPGPTKVRPVAGASPDHARVPRPERCTPMPGRRVLGSALIWRRGVDRLAGGSRSVRHH